MITLHHCPQSRSMRVLWLLEELDVPYRVQVRAFDKSLRAPEFLSLSPAGRVPALEIDGERMFESAAIMEYLCERFQDAGLGRLPGDMDRMAWLVWLHFAETISQHVAALTQQHILLYELEAWMDRITDRDGFRAALPKPEEALIYTQPFYPAWEQAAGAE